MSQMAFSRHQTFAHTRARAQASQIASGLLNVQSMRVLDGNGVPGSFHRVIKLNCMCAIAMMMLAHVSAQCIVNASCVCIALSVNFQN